MAKTTRTKEIWHIPKRGNLHQTAYMVTFLSQNRFNGKSWTHTKQENLSSEMGKSGVTDSGRAISNQSIRTLLANIPKYLGFVYIDKSSTPAKIWVTDAGNELIANHDINSIPKHPNLRTYKSSGDLIKTSEVFKKQMSKLIITNPLILKDCENILVFPFRMALRALLELDYLDLEEIAYILFHIKSESQYPVLIQRIKNFRSLEPKKRALEVRTYKGTEEGWLTLGESSATSKYFAYLCTTTGLCYRSKVNVNNQDNPKLMAIKLINKDDASQILDLFENAEIYDFGNNLVLWNDYFSVPSRLYPPHNLTLEVKSDDEVFVIVTKEGRMLEGDLISENNPSIVFPVFRDEEYHISVYDIDEGKEVYNKLLSFSKDDKEFIINLKLSKQKKPLNLKETVSKIKEMFSSSHGFDEEYYRKLETLEKILGKNIINNGRKGGRLEYLFFILLSLLKEKGIIDDVNWFGEIVKYGLCKHAPAGKYGNPDITFEIDDYLFVLELTTIYGSRAQWRAEASSVPDHISRIKGENPHKNVIGIFSAPSIDNQTERNLTLNAKDQGVGMLFIECTQLADLLLNADRDELIDKLVKMAETQLKSV